MEDCLRETGLALDLFFQGGYSICFVLHPSSEGAQKANYFQALDHGTKTTTSGGEEAQRGGE